MNEEQFVTLNEDFIDFLQKVVRNYEVSFPQLAGIIMARMTSLAVISNSQSTMLELLPAMEKTLRDNNDTFH
jgi:hypothetical protein